MPDINRRRGYWQIAAAMPVTAGIAHLITIFLAAGATESSAFTRLSATLKPNVMTMMEPVGPGHQKLLYLSPDSRYAFCLFSTAAGPVRVNAILPDFGWTLGVFRPDGSSAYFAAAAAGRETEIALTLVPDDDRFLGMTPQALGRSIDVSPQLTVAAREGVVVLRAPDSGPSASAAAQDYLAKAACASVSY